MSKAEPPHSQPYYQLWGKHEFDMSSQRNILLNFLHDSNLDDAFIQYIDKHFPEDENGFRQEVP